MFGQIVCQGMVITNGNNALDVLCLLVNPMVRFVRTKEEMFILHKKDILEEGQANQEFDDLFVEMVNKMEKDDIGLFGFDENVLCTGVIKGPFKYSRKLLSMEDAEQILGDIGTKKQIGSKTEWAIDVLGEVITFGFSQNYCMTIRWNEKIVNRENDYCFAEYFMKCVKEICN